MKNLLWMLINLIENNYGYSTPIQKRFKIGDRVKISQYSISLKPHIFVKILEVSRHDYLIEDNNHIRYVVYQFELYK